MAKSYASTVIDAPAADVWARIRDFNGLATWHGGLVATSEIEDGKAGDQVGSIRELHAHRRHTPAGAAARALGRRALLYVRLPEDAVRRRQLRGDHSRQPRHRRQPVVRGVVDDVRLRPREAGALGGFLRQPGLPGRARRAEGPLRGLSASAGSPRAPWNIGRSTSRKKPLCRLFFPTRTSSYHAGSCGMAWQHLLASRRRRPASLSSRPGRSRPWASCCVPTACGSPARRPPRSLPRRTRAPIRGPPRHRD